MDSKQPIDPDKPSKRKLSVEELLAGKSSAEEVSDTISTDARFKSPDEILVQMMAQRQTKSSEVTIQHGYRRGETTLGPNAAVERMPDSKKLKDDLDALTNRYSQDKKRWKEYEQNILQWKTQVMMVIQNLQNDTGELEGLKKEIETLKELNRQKDDEIRSLVEETKKSSAPNKKK